MAILAHASMDAFPNAILWPLFPAATKLTDYGFLYGYLGLIFGFGVTALLLIFLHVAAWVTNTTDQKTRVSRRHRIDSSASVARQRHNHRR